MVISNSNYNIVGAADITGFASGGAAILLTADSSYNLVATSTVEYTFGNGVEVDLDSQANLIRYNNVTIDGPTTYFALLDENPDCGSSVWIGNTFTNTFDPSQVSASPASCIR
jgi:hypothetical protein